MEAEFSAETTMNPAEAEFLAEEIKKAHYFLEFGAGYSTKLALKNPNCQVISIETSEKYIENLRSELTQEGLDTSRVKFLHVDIGPTRDWGRPTDESKIDSWPNYTVVPWQFIKNQNFKPDLILMDINMPIMDGLTAAEKIVNSTPVLMLTAFSQRDLVMKASEIGVMGYVVKPFTINDLIPAMEVATSRFRVMSELSKEVADLSQKLEVRKLVDKAKGILMKALNLSEAEAFSWIQKTAMDRRLTMKEVAEAVISPDAAPER